MKSTPMIKTTLPAIKKFLADDKVDAEIQAETDQLYFILKISDREIPVFLRLLHEGRLIQLLAFLPFQPLPTVFPELARWLHYINKEIDLPGFGMDETTRLTFYRSMITARNQKISPARLRSYVISLNEVCRDFVDSIEEVATGQVSFEKILERKEEIFPR
ncbi:MAG: YbjN domain-containing protein [Chlamydiota bacterium]